MSNLNIVFRDLFDQHDRLLKDLDKTLQLERKALLSHDIESLRQHSLSKEKAVRRIELSHRALIDSRQRLASELGLVHTTSLEDLFQQWGHPEAKMLSEKRRQLIQLSKRINRVNEFISHCLKTYLNHISGVKRIINLHHGDEAISYARNGSNHARQQGGRLIDRSF